MRLEGNNLYPDEGCWLYQDEGQKREFYPSVTLAKPENAQYFSECTNAEKEAWEEEHNPPEPEEEIQDAEKVNE